MDVELLGPESPKWQAFLDTTEHDFYHLPRYVELCARGDGAEPCALHVEDGSRRLLLPLLVRPIGDGSRDAASPYGYPGPLVGGPSDPSFVGEALAAAKNALAGERIVTLFVRGHPLVGPALCAPGATVVEHGPTVSIDLTRTAEDLWRHTTSGHRNEISKAIRAGHLARLDERFDHLETFAGIYRETMARLGAAEHYFFTDRYFLDLRDALREGLHLCVVDIGGAIAGAGLFVETGGLVQYHLSGTDPRFVRERPTKLMLHFMRTWAAERGFRRLHLGGGVGGAEDSLFRFKAGFATDRHTFATLRLVCDEDAYGALVRATHPGADPADREGFFPLYRKPA